MFGDSKRWMLLLCITPFVSFDFETIQERENKGIFLWQRIHRSLQSWTSFRKGPRFAEGSSFQVSPKINVGLLRRSRPAHLTVSVSRFVKKMQNLADHEHSFRFNAFFSFLFCFVLFCFVALHLELHNLESLDRLTQLKFPSNNIIQVEEGYFLILIITFYKALFSNQS